MLKAALMAAALWTLTATTAVAQQRCVMKEYGQYKDQMATANGRYNLPIDYCIAEVRQSRWGSSSQSYADCDAEMGKMKDAMLKARQPKLVAFAEARCEGAHPLGKK